MLFGTKFWIQLDPSKKVQYSSFPKSKVEIVVTSERNVNKNANITPTDKKEY
jgi:hypothetical protein